jgi:hypothetical protein
VARDDLWVKKLPGITQGTLHFSSKIVSAGMELSDLLKIFGHINTKRGLVECKIKEISISFDSGKRTPYKCHSLDSPRNGPFQIHHLIAGRMECPGSPIFLEPP